MKTKTSTSNKLTIATLLGVGAVVSVLSVSAFARGPSPLPNDLPLRVDAYTEVLNLDAAQTDKLKEVLKDARTKRYELREKHVDSISAQRAEMDALDASTNAAIAKILTEEQKEKLADEAGVRGDYKGRRGFGPGWCWNDDDDDRDAGRGRGRYGRGYMMDRYNNNGNGGYGYCDGPYGRR